MKQARLYTKLWWIAKQLRCSHSHTWAVTPSREWQSDGRIMQTPHNGLVLEGCYLCGKVWTRDTMGPNGPTRESV